MSIISTPGSSLYGDAMHGEHIYDEFLGKWVRKYKAKRKKKKAAKTQTPIKSPAPPGEREVMKPMKKIPPKLIEVPLSRKEARMHRNMELAKQMEYKTKEAELQTLEKEKKLEQEDQVLHNKKTQKKWINVVGGVIVVGGILLLGNHLMNQNKVAAQGGTATN